MQVQTEGMPDTKEVSLYETALLSFGWLIVPVWLQGGQAGSAAGRPAALLSASAPSQAGL